jgi:hypothetical protein
MCCYRSFSIRAIPQQCPDSGTNAETADTEQIEWVLSQMKDMVG